MTRVREFIFYSFNYFKMETFSYNTVYLPTVIVHVRAPSLQEVLPDFCLQELLLDCVVNFYIFFFLTSPCLFDIFIHLFVISEIRNGSIDRNV